MLWNQWKRAQQQATSHKGHHGNSLGHRGYGCCSRWRGSGLSLDVPYRVTPRWVVATDTLLLRTAHLDNLQRWTFTPTSFPQRRINTWLYERDRNFTPAILLLDPDLDPVGTNSCSLQKMIQIIYRPFNTLLADVLVVEIPRWKQANIFMCLFDGKSSILISCVKT